MVIARKETNKGYALIMAQIGASRFIVCLMTKYGMNLMSRIFDDFDSANKFYKVQEKGGKI